MDRYFLAKNNLVQEPKHREKMGDAVWQYLFYLSYANCRNGKTVFYPKTYAKLLKVDFDLVLARQKLLEKEGYIVAEYIEENVYKIEIVKPINVCLP